MNVLKKLWCTHTHTHTDYHSAMRKKKILLFVRTKIDVEGIMLMEISHTEKDKHSMMSLNTWKLKKLNIYTENRMMVIRG